MIGGGMFSVWSIPFRSLHLCDAIPTCRSVDSIKEHDELGGMAARGRRSFFVIPRSTLAIKDMAILSSSGFRSMLCTLNHQLFTASCGMAVTGFHQKAQPGTVMHGRVFLVCYTSVPCIGLFLADCYKFFHIESKNISLHVSGSNLQVILFHNKFISSINMFIGFNYIWCIFLRGYTWLEKSLLYCQLMIGGCMLIFSSHILACGGLYMEIDCKNIFIWSQNILDIQLQIMFRIARFVWFLLLDMGFLVQQKVLVSMFHDSINIIQCQGLLHTQSNYRYQLSYFFCLHTYCDYLTMASNFHADNTAANRSAPANSNSDLLDCCLVGRLLISKPVHFNSFRDRMAQVWKPERKVEISRIDNNRFVFQFFHHKDMERVVRTGPWLFDNFPLVLQKVSFGDDPTTTPLDTIEMWVQAHNLPFGFMTESMGILLGSHVGGLVKYDAENNFGSWRRYMRLRVALKVGEPLVASWAFEREGAAAVTVFFRYEKLSNFCYVCGRLGHNDSYCPDRYEDDYVEEGKRWGPILRAEFKGSSSGGVDNQWLHDSRKSGGENDGAMHEGMGHAVYSFNHAKFGRVKIGRDLVTKVLLFFKLVNGTWVTFDPARCFIEESVPHVVSTTRNTAPVLQLANNHDPQSIGAAESDEERISRLVQEARLKNPLSIESAPSNFVSTAAGQPPISDLSTSLAHMLKVGLSGMPTPKVSDDGTVKFASKGPKHLKRLRVEELKDTVEKTKEGVEMKGSNVSDGGQDTARKDVVMRDMGLGGINNVMAGPGHQACQGK